DSADTARPRRRGDRMRRREFMLALGGVATAIPGMARAQSAAIPAIGFLSPRSPEESAALVAALRQGLAASGVIEGEGATIEFRWGRGAYDQLPAMAAELAGRPVTAFITVGGEPSVLAAKAAA